MRNISKTSEWHGLLWYSPRQEQKPGTVIRLGIEMQLTRDGSQSCAASGADLITLRNGVSVTLGEAPLPRFDANWLYGDLHYHSQGSDNEGEAAYNFRGVARALGALGMDFVFATDHASNSKQIMDADVSMSLFSLGENVVGCLFGKISCFLDPDLHDAHTSGGVLRDMNRERFEQSYDLIYGSKGVNEEAGAVTGNGKAPQGVLSHGVAPQVFLGGEVDVIPELGPSDPNRDRIPYGNGLEYDLNDLCGGWVWKLEQGLWAGLAPPSPKVHPCDVPFDFDPTQYVAETNDYLVRDIQGINEEGYARLHLVYLPKQPERDAFVASKTGKYGGATRRLADTHNGQPSMLSDVERHGYAFIAHPMTVPDPAAEGPDVVPWSEHLLRKAWSSRAILGLEFWNEDARLRDTLNPSEITKYSTLPIHWDTLKPGDEVGYGRPKASRMPDTAPTSFYRQGFETGLFELYPHNFKPDDKPGRWDEMIIGIKAVEHTLAHGAYTWDQINHWGLNTRQTSSLSWLRPGEPRRFFMAGGSDAHGDFNYRRNGYFIGTTNLTDTAIGKPRNLVYVRPGLSSNPSDTLAPPDRNPSPGNIGTGLPSHNPSDTLAPPTNPNPLPSAPNFDTVGPVDPPSGDVPRHSQEQVVDALTEGHFSITDGPALRIVVDRNRNGRIDRGDTPMGGIVDLYGGEQSLPLLIQWKSTPEFGPVSNIDIYVGAGTTNESVSTTGRVYAPEKHGPRGRSLRWTNTDNSFLTQKHPTLPHTYFSNGLTYELMADDYWRDPTGDLRILSAGLEGLRAVTLNLKAYEVAPGHIGDRFFVRAFARTHVLTQDLGACPPEEFDPAGQDEEITQSPEMRRGECIRRYAFTNPIWAIQRASCPTTANRGIDGDGDGIPDGCDPVQT